MPHADSASLPSYIRTRTEFWIYVYDQLASLLEGQRAWVTNLANASSLIYNALLAFPEFGDGPSAVNWCGFYLHSSLFPPSIHSVRPNPGQVSPDRLLLGPFCGKPACQFINVAPGKTRGVCADAYTSQSTKLVPDVHAYPGHIACDGDTNSEIVCSLLLKVDDKEVALGVLDLDCLAKSGFTEEDKAGLEKIVELVVRSCDW